MKNSRCILENAIQRAKALGIKIEFEDIDDVFFNMTITSNRNNCYNLNHIFTHAPYAELDTLNEEELLEKIKELSDYQFKN